MPAPGLLISLIPGDPVYSLSGLGLSIRQVIYRLKLKHNSLVSISRRHGDFASKVKNNFETQEEQQLSNKVHQCRIDRERIHIWIIPLGPEVVGKEMCDNKRCKYLCNRPKNISARSNLIHGWELTAAPQKNIMEKTMNNNGRLSQPKRIEKNVISTGMVMIGSVSMARRGLGSGFFDGFEYKERPWWRRRAASCNDVDSPEMRMELVAPEMLVKRFKMEDRASDLGHTTNNHCKEGEPFIPTHKHI